MAGSYRSVLPGPEGGGPSFLGMGIPNFFYHPRMTSYDFGPQHPLKPERLRRTIALLEALVPGFESLDPGLATEDDLLRLHSRDYVDFVQNPRGKGFGLGTLDTPLFPGIYEASLAYTGGTLRAAEAVRDGAPLAFGIAGGLHHAQKDHASGFCVFNDPALACHILRERFDRVAYVDIDLHHGDGVQDLFWEDPSVLTLSIHQKSPGFYPGTGSHTETGAGLTSVNIPLPPGCQGGPWLHAFRSVAEMAFQRFEPQAVVLQMGTDPHILDPLGSLQVRAQDWLEAVAWVRDLGLPLVACGGGGYRLSCVPRMWAAAVLTLCGLPVPEKIPDAIPSEWAMTTFHDPDLQPEEDGLDHAERLISWWRETLRAEG